MSSFAEGRHIITTGRYRITDTTDTIITQCTEGLPYIIIDTGDHSRRPATITVEHRMGKSAGTTTEDMGPYPAEGTGHRRIAVEEGATRMERSAFVDNKCIISKNKEIAKKQW